MGKDENLSWEVIFDFLKKKRELPSDLQLAKSLGVSRGFLCAIKKGRRNMPAQRGLDILNELDIKLRDDEFALLLAGSKVRKALNKYDT